MKIDQSASPAPARPRRADYFLYTWQIRAIQRMSRDNQKTSSEIVRELISQALSLRETPDGNPPLK